MPPAYVKPYVKRQKNDATDAEAICEAVARANMRFVRTKTPEQQSGLVLHRTRHLFVRQQTSLINVIRAHLAEFGIVAPVGRHGVEELLGIFTDPSDPRVATFADPTAFRSGRNFSVWIGLVPKQHSSGGKEGPRLRHTSSDSPSSP
jgi:transposase